VTEEFRETEFKFRVASDFLLPEFTSLGFRVNAQPPVTLDADYYDTERTTLLRWGVTLRRRSGGSDDGWHAKVPVLGADASTRDEIRVSAMGDTVPTELVQILTPLLRGQDVVLRAHVETQRTSYLISSSADEALIELVDDYVDVSGAGTRSAFRELELELVAESPAARAAVTLIGDHLTELGATPSSVSKAASALGDLGPPDVPEFAPVGPEGLAVDALRSVLARHVRHLMMSDVAVRRDLPDSVHQMRVAARRLRSTFSTYRSLLDKDSVAPVREDLSWLARELGAVRDAEVIHALLVDLGSELGEVEDREAALDTVDRWHERRMPAARASVMAALRTDRHDQLLEDLIAFVTEPPVTDEAFRPVEDVLLPRVRRTWRRLAHRVDALDSSAPDEQWHEVRILAKKARYAAEGLGPVMGKHMMTCASALAKVTDLLGTHQDAHVARTVLRTLATGSETSPREAFALGMMSQHEAERQQDFRKEFRHMWPDVVQAAHKAGLE
jgi:CHAD domain-containing protein